MSCLGNNRLTAVVVPLTTREIRDLEVLFFIWAAWESVGSPNVAPDPPRLIVSLDCAPDADVAAEVRRLYAAYDLDRKFAGVSLAFCDLSPEENIYVRHGQDEPDVLPPLGLKSGPNTQFFRSILDHCSAENTVLLNEVDCLPVVPDWLERISELVRQSEPFWILGSPYRGSGRLGPEVVSHVNGNALYGIGADGFKEFARDIWYRELRESVPGNPDLAFDTALSRYFSELLNPATWGGVAAETFLAYQEYLCKVRFTSLIHNLAGTDEIAGFATVDLARYLGQHPAAVLVHGRFLVDQAIDRAASQLLATNDDARNWVTHAATRMWHAGQREVSRRLVQLLTAGMPRGIGKQRSAA